jgi:hypothetical protein
MQQSVVTNATNLQQFEKRNIELGHCASKKVTYFVLFLT